MTLFFCGCTKINDLEVIDIVNTSINTDIKLTNQYRNGYKYYLPRGMSIISNRNYNEIIRSGRSTYYLYIDVISYYNKVVEPYEINDKAYYSKSLSNGDKFGYIEINIVNNKYLLEIMYNYAKIEVIVREDELNVVVSNAISILSTIYYNDNIIDNLLGDNILDFNEIDFDIFDTKGESDSPYLEAHGEYGQYEEEEEYDPDLIN